jgi:hypothetical protein
MPASLVRYFHIESKDLVYLKFILEAYEGLAVLSTEDSQRGIIRITVPSGLGDELNGLLHALHPETSFLEVYPPDFDPALENTRREHCHA